MLSDFILCVSSVHTQMVNLYRDPTGEKVFESANPSKLAQPKTTSEHHSMAMGLSELTDAEKVELLDSTFSLFFNFSLFFFAHELFM